MTQFQVQGYRERTIDLEGWPTRVASYQLATRWAAKVDNVSPGAIIARGEGATREEAETEALELAAKRLRTTRRLEVLEKQVGDLQAELSDLRKDA